VSTAAYAGKSMQEYGLYGLNDRRIPAYASCEVHWIPSGLTRFRRGTLSRRTLRDRAAEMLADPALPLKGRRLLESYLVTCAETQGRSSGSNGVPRRASRGKP
jgi:hypothetical protein